PTHGLRYHIVSRPMYVRTLSGARISKAANACIYQPGIDFLQHFVSKAQSLHDPNPKVLQKHIHVLYKMQKNIATGLLLEIQRDTGFVTINAIEVTIIEVIVIIIDVRSIP